MIEDLLEHIGIEDLQPREDEIGGRCPMHEARTGEREHRPRHWSVNRRTGVHHCFSCGYSGSLIRLIMDMTNVGLWNAYLFFHRYAIDLESPEGDETWIPPDPEVDLEHQLAEFGPPPARAMERRRLRPEWVEHFGVRWDYEESAWIFPIFGPANGLWGWQTKAAEYVRNRPPGIKKSRTLFGLNVLQSAATVVLVESPLDAIYLNGLGYPAVASFGASVSDQQMRLLLDHVDQLVLALDNDKAGIAETRRLLDERWHHRLPIQVFNYSYTRAKDPGECLQEEIDAGMDDTIMAAFW